MNKNHPLFNQILDEAFDFIRTSDYDKALAVAERYITRDNLASFLGSALAVQNKILPNKKFTISSSSLLTHPTLSGDIFKINNPSQFLFHTKDNNPWVVIDLGKKISRQSNVFIYNRCHGDEISERILGCNFYASPDGNEWTRIHLCLDDDQIYKHKEIKIVHNSVYRFLRIDRDEGQLPIHLSQITVGQSLMDAKASPNTLEFCNRLFAKLYQLKISSSGQIIENVPWKRFLQFATYRKNTELSIRVSRTGRFSNLLFQITNAIYFASKTGIRIISIPADDRVRNLFPDDDTIACKTYPVRIKVAREPKGPVLEGMFLYNHELSEVFTKNRPGIRALVDEIREYCKLESSPCEHDARDLTIHIRSGDVFGSRNIHPGYGQPPLAFYVKTILHYRPRRVILVFEDKLNPVIQGLVDYLESVSIEYTIQSSTNLRDDIKTLASAKALVIGKGTFARGVLCFNQVLERLYTFNKPIQDDVLPQDPGRSISLYNIEDRSRQYVKNIMQHNWSNSEEQRNLMLSYPQENLVLQSNFT